MKKTLVALAAMTAMCGASATSVTLYGVVDTGFAYNSVNTDDFAGLAGKGGDSFSMESGQRSGSRFGMKGVEDLGNGLQVGFVLENGFYSDTGADKDAFFDRESSLYLEGSFGKFGMGRLSTFANDAGSTGIGGYFSSFGTGCGDVGVQNYMQAYRPTRMDNVVYYKSPNFAGAEVWVMYGMGSNDSENESGSDRYYAAAVTYNNGGLSLYGAVDVLNKQTWDNEANGPVPGHGKDQITVTAAVNYDCGYLDASSDAYNQVSNREVDKDFSRFMAAAGYEYYLSKRTTLYAGAGYIQDSVANSDPRWVQVNCGLTHKF